jgi:polysaccharide biosynthesis transport protein
MSDKYPSLVKAPRAEIVLEDRSAIERRTLSQSQLSLPEIWQTLAKRKVAILVFTAIVFVLVAGYTFSRTPVYEGVARLQIDPTRSSTLGLDDGDKTMSTDPDSRVRTEVAIIQSNTVAMQVITSMKLYSNSHFTIATDQIVTGVHDPGELTATQRHRLLERFHDNLSVKVLPTTQVVEIRFRSPDPVIATETPNSVIDEYMQRNFHTRVDGTAEVSQWLSKQMEDVRASTTAAQEKLAEFQKKHNLLGTDESNNTVTDRLKQLNEELTQAEADRILKEGRYRLARSGNPELVDSRTPNPTLQTLRTQEAELQAQYAQLNAKFGSAYPKVRELQSQLENLNVAINDEVLKIRTRLGNEYDAAAKAEAMIHGDFEKQKEETYKLNENVSQYAILKHEVESGQRLYDTLQLKVKEAGVTSGLTSSYISVVDRAQLPDKPVEPRKALYLALGLSTGLFGGIVLGLVLDSFDDSLRTSEEIEALTALPELVSIPFLSPLAKKNHKRLSPAGLLGLQDSELNSLFMTSHGPEAEAYRALGSVILLSCLDNPPKVLVVTSAMPGEGKSTISCNLAAALAQRGRRVLLVDADLRSASIQSQLGLRPGLNTVFATGPTQYSWYQPIKSLPTLHVVPTGFRPTDPDEIADPGRIKELLQGWSAEYDHVIIDTPPVLLFADVLVMAARADAVILVTRAGVSRAKATLRARDVLSRSGSNILGFVLNGAKKREYYYDYPPEYRRLIRDSYSDSTRQAAS